MTRQSSHPPRPRPLARCTNVRASVPRSKHTIHTYHITLARTAHHTRTHTHSRAHSRPSLDRSNDGFNLVSAFSARNTAEPQMSKPRSHPLLLSSTIPNPHPPPTRHELARTLALEDGEPWRLAEAAAARRGVESAGGVVPADVDRLRATAAGAARLSRALAQGEVCCMRAAARVGSCRLCHI